MKHERERKKGAKGGGSPPSAQNDEEESASAGGLPDLLRKGLSLGFSGLFFTEEAVRKAFGDTVPKDWIDFATEQSTRTRSEFLERLAAELAQSLESLDLAQILDTLLSGRTIEIKAEIHLKERGAAEDDARPLRISLAERRTGKR